MSWLQHAPVACDEGWSIFESRDNPYGDAPYQLQKLDEEQLFDDDLAAHRHVVTCVQRGSTHAIAALIFLREESKPELLNVYFSYLHGGVGYTWEDVVDGDYTDAALDRLELTIFGRIVTRTHAPFDLPQPAQPA